MIAEQSSGLLPARRKTQFASFQAYSNVLTIAPRPPARARDWIPQTQPLAGYLTAATMEISTKMASEAMRASTQQRAGSQPLLTQASHTLFISLNKVISFT